MSAELSIISGVIPKKRRVSKMTELNAYPIDRMPNSKESTETFLKIDNPFQMDFIHAALFATILEDVITELRIVGNCNNELRIMKVMANIGNLRAKKFGVPQASVTDELEGIDKNNLDKEEYKLVKGASDRKLITETILLTYKELSLNRSTQVLQEKCREILERNSHRETQVLEEAQNKLARKELARQLRVQRNHFKSANYETSALIDKLNVQVEDMILNSEVRNRYVDSWERSRTEQQRTTIQTAEDATYSSINKYKSKFDSEQRVHSELMLLMHIIVNETIGKVEEMMVKYERDMEDLDLKIQIMKVKHQEAMESRINLEKMYIRHEKEAREWKQFKEERLKKIEYRTTMHNAAIVAQAWWRGIMVRQQLGPYRPQRQLQGKPNKRKK